MNKKTLIAVIILALVGAGLYYVLTTYKPVASPVPVQEMGVTEEGADVNSGMNVEGSDGVVRGTVVSVDTEQAMVDGPYVINISQAGGATAVVLVPSMGLPTCVARANIADVYALTAGQVVEARGSIGENNRVIPCESASHYLRVIEPQ